MRIISSEPILNQYTLKVFQHGDPGLTKDDIVPEEWNKMKNILLNFFTDLENHLER